MAPIVDLTGISTSLEVIPNNEIVPATLESWEYSEKAKSSGKPKVDLTFEITEGEYEGRKLFRTFSLQRQSLWSFKRTLVMLGAPDDQLEGPIDLEDLMPELVGAPCFLQVGVHTYEDEERNDVKKVLPEDYAFSSDVGAGGSL